MTLVRIGFSSSQAKLLQLLPKSNGAWTLKKLLVRCQWIVSPYKHGGTATTSKLSSSHTMLDPIWQIYNAALLLLWLQLMCMLVISLKTLSENKCCQFSILTGRNNWDTTTTKNSQLLPSSSRFRQHWTMDWSTWELLHVLLSLL